MAPSNDKTPIEQPQTRLMISTPSARPTSNPTGVTSAIAQVQDPRPGDVLGDYTLLDLIARGGMGQVWRAKHATLHRVVALKLMRRWSVESWSRFEREARLASTLDHPHIAKLYEFSREPPFIAFQLIAGSSLTGADARSIGALRDAALAVQHAHDHGVLHRDLKPDNIIVDPAGQAFVLDFGLARTFLDTEMDQITISGEVVGTPAYMSPEQAAGEGRSLTPAADVYALGATLYTLLADHPPYQGSGVWEVIRQVIDGSHPPPGGDRDLETICLKAMAHDPARRYASARAFADDLSRWLAREPVLARRASLGYRLLRHTQRHRLVWTLGGVLSLVVLITSVVAVLLLATVHERQRQAQSADQERHRILDQRADQSAIEELASSSERELTQLGEDLALQLDDLHLNAAMHQVDGLIDHLAQARQRWPEEGILGCLEAEAELLRNDEPQAMVDFTWALAHRRGFLTNTSGLIQRASLGRAMARLRLDFIDQLAQLFIFDDQAGYLASARDGVAVQADLEQSGASASSYRLQVLTLWSRYLRAASSSDRYTLYVAIQNDAIALAARGGRDDEWANLLAGVLCPPPRALATVEGYYNAALSRSHALPQVWLLRALERAYDGQPDGARADCDQAIRLRPHYALARLLRAQLNVDGSPEDLAQARLDILDAAGHEAHQPAIWLAKAHIEWRVGDGAAAVRDARMAAATAAGCPTYRGRARLLDEVAAIDADAGLTADQDHALRDSVALGDDDARCQLATLALAQGRQADALAVLAPLLIDAPGADRLHACTRARTLRQNLAEGQGRLADARQDCQWIRSHVPSYLPAQIDEARLACADDPSVTGVQARFAHLIIAVQSTLTVAGNGLTPDQGLQLQARAYGEAGQLLSARGDQAGALADAQQALDLVPTDEPALRLQIAILETQGDHERAQERRRDLIHRLDASAADQLAHRHLSEAAQQYRLSLVLDDQQHDVTAGLAQIASIQAQIAHDLAMPASLAVAASPPALTAPASRP